MLIGCVPFSNRGNFKRTDGKHKAWAHPNQGVDEGILKPTSLISNAARGRAFVRCKRKDHKEEQTLITPPTKHLGEMANSTLVLLVNIWKPLTSKPLPTHAHKATYSSTQCDPHTACVCAREREHVPHKKKKMFTHQRKTAEARSSTLRGHFHSSNICSGFPE